MAFLAILLAFLPIIFIVYFSRSVKSSSSNLIPWNWPLLGMIPTVIAHSHRIYERITEVLEQTGCSFFFRGIWFANIDMLLTADPANIHYILSTNFERYPKGPEFKYIFDILGDGIFNSDSDLWRNQRRMGQALLHSKQFLQFLVKTTKRKVEESLFPVLESISKNGSVIDLQDLFQRLAFDCSCKMITGFDLNNLSVEFPEVPFSKAMDDAEQVLFLRHLLPRFLWEFQKKLNLGHEKTMKQAWETVDRTIAEFIATKRERKQQKIKEEDEYDMITSYLKDECYNLELINDKFLRDTVLNFMVAGRDALSTSLSWFFFCVSNNPTVQTKIREELKSIIPPNEPQEGRIFSIEEVNNLVYLHGAFCETLRLYPSVPFQYKLALKDDILPSGQKVTAKTRIVISIYALGRMTSVWGKDCMEFKPERWITERGTVKHEPSNRFLAFNAGPRTCIGKEVAFTQLKMVAAAIIHNYNIQSIGSRNGTPKASVILHMKHGFNVKITNRWC